MTLACIAEKAFEEAVGWAEQAQARHRHSAVVLRGLAVALAHAGRADRAKEVVAELLAIEPQVTVSAWIAGMALADTDFVATFVDGLRKAGLPE
jgi:Flp pilus assembly protein TadD